MSHGPSMANVCFPDDIPVSCAFLKDSCKEYVIKSKNIQPKLTPVDLQNHPASQEVVQYWMCRGNECYTPDALQHVAVQLV
jgi:hypothetical protein